MYHFKLKILQLHMEYCTYKNNVNNVQNLTIVFKNITPWKLSRSVAIAETTKLTEFYSMEIQES